MSCCRAVPCEEMFKPRMARRSLNRYRSRGLDRLDRAVLAAASAGGVEGSEVLEIGGGIGAIQSELLDSGARRGEIVELVSSWEPYAIELARERGHGDSTTFRIADVLEEPETVEQADVVVLNRVVCCSPDGVELARSAARLTRRTLVLSYPRNAFWLRAGAWVMNGAFRALGRSYRLFLHPRSALVAAAGAEGLILEDEGRTFVWEYIGFRRLA
ncbi:MAG TPA: methyltransferase domain-containing protein [Gaiellaceae bacterium]|nr:methyltransferase domain-containing protein [Gaiellaceae bacterium]